MSDIALLIPIAAITIGPLSWVANNWLRVRHGHPPEAYKSRRERRRNAEEAGLDDARKVQLLTSENEALTAKLARMEERMAVMERIVTDPAERTAREIDALR